MDNQQKIMLCRVRALIATGMIEVMGICNVNNAYKQTFWDIPGKCLFAIVLHKNKQDIRECFFLTNHSSSRL